MVKTEEKPFLKEISQLRSQGIPPKICLTKKLFTVKKKIVEHQGKIFRNENYVTVNVKVLYV